jgi:hypothetical protein
MDREQLGRMNLEALRVLAAEHGVGGARALGRAELIDKLAPRSLVERAKEAVAHAVEAVEDKAHELRDRVLHPHAPSDEDKDVAAVADVEPPLVEPRGNGFGVPSSTVHPHFAHPQGEPAAPAEPTRMLDFEELPETYGVDECEVLFKDPFWVFAYWEVTDSGVQAARAQLGQSADASRLVLRLFTTIPKPEGVERQINDVELPWNHGRRYMQAPKSGAHLRVAVGLLSREGYFAPIAHSSLLRVPPAEPQPGPVEWMEVVPARSRGRAKEPLVIVRRGNEHAERGVKAPEALGGESAGTSPTARPGAPGFPFGGAGGASSPGRRDGGQ